MVIDSYTIYYEYIHLLTKRTAVVTYHTNVIDSYTIYYEHCDYIHLLTKRIVILIDLDQSV